MNKPGWRSSITTRLLLNGEFTTRHLRFNRQNPGPHCWWLNSHRWGLYKYVLPSFLNDIHMFINVWWLKSRKQDVFLTLFHNYSIRVYRSWSYYGYIPDPQDIPKISPYVGSIMWSHYFSLSHNSCSWYPHKSTKHPFAPNFLGKIPVVPIIGGLIPYYPTTSPLYPH